MMTLAKIPPRDSAPIRMPSSCPNRTSNFPHYLFLDISMRKYRPSPRGRFVRAHLRRSLTKPGDYLNVADYQEKFDRLRAKLKRFAALQLILPFSIPPQPEPEDSDYPDPARQNE
jgi:hypothetical protein